MNIGKLNPLGKINFPGFQEILDFTATGSESSVSVTVDGNTDKEYIIFCTDSSKSIGIRLNNDSGANYGRQYLYNNGGTISANRGITNEWQGERFEILNISTPSGFIKTAYHTSMNYSSGTTMATFYCAGLSYNSTSNITLITFFVSSGNFTSGTRIVVYARRSQS